MKGLEKKAVTIFSRYIRLRDSQKCGSVGLDWVNCYTCGTSVLIGEAEAGHFIKRGKTIFKFAEWNSNAQCTRCNHFLNGNDGIYAIKLIKEYGFDFIEDKKKHENDYYKFKREELESIIRKCANKIADII